MIDRTEPSGQKSAEVEKDHVTGDEDRRRD